MMLPLNDSCPVCGMQPEVEVVSVEHHKMYFYFCSEQCRETFIARPSLYVAKIGKQRDVILKRRTMYFSESLGAGVGDLLIPYLKDLMGVKEVTVEAEKIEISYDLLQVTERQIEKALEDVGVQLGGSWLERLRRGWVNDSEEIELDNLAEPPAPCCNRTLPKT